MASSGGWCVVVGGFGRKQIFKRRKAECELVSAGIEGFRRKVKQKVERQSVEEFKLRQLQGSDRA
jgi:hypothetical protein